MLISQLLEISSRFDSFQKYTYSQTWPKNCYLIALFERGVLF